MIAALILIAIVVTVIVVWCDIVGLFSGKREVKGRCGHEDCLGPEIAANRGGCRMQTWSDVG